MEDTPAPLPDEEPSLDGPLVTEKLHKVLARAGLGSRRACENIIREGRVEVNGRRAKIEDRVVADEDHITVDRRPIPHRPAPIYILLHKPKGYITSVGDPHGRRSVDELVKSRHRLYPVGRLDADSTGLLIMTNDGDLTQRLLHPRYHVPRVYMVRVRGDVPPVVLGRLRHGVMLDDGPTLPARVEMLERSHNTTVLRFVLEEGRKRQIRRMCEAVSHPVLDLQRVAMGPLRLGDLGVGRWRHLTASEVLQLEQAAAAGERTRARQGKPRERR